MAIDQKTKKRQYEFAKLLVEGSLTIPEAYKIAYKDLLEENPPESENKLVNRAYTASKASGVQKQIKQMQERLAVEEARLLVWDKRKASKYLLDRCGEIESNMQIIRQLRDSMLEDKKLSDIAKLKLMNELAFSMNDTARVMKDVATEMNKLYGLQDPKTSMGQAVQIIIGRKDENMPDDTLDWEDK